ncbi:hypothetical protein [Phytoactinopolyspora limicola]|uniref:hypothetical protein n=1 Tax=Phytoactinopolyspora limicola TaxID=2715536 RepID=UPI00140E7D70|nr:hypothetical protein [Phytoactinopolyspora limicola]
MNLRAPTITHLLAFTAITALAVAACGSDTEPATVAPTTPATTTSNTLTPEPDPTGNPEPTDEPPEETTNDVSSDDDPTPVATFTQPYLPQENVVELRDVIPITPPDDATDEELDVIEALGHYEAAWEQLLWGVPFEDSGMQQHAIDPNLTTTREYAEQMIDEELVHSGPPVDEIALSVEIDGGTATAAVCIDNRGWFYGPAGVPPTADDPFYLTTPTLQHLDGRWMVSNVSYNDDLAPCEGLFE